MPTLTLSTPARPPTEQPSTLQRARTFYVHLLLAPTAAVLGIAAAVFGAHRRFINEDGISYLDVASSYLEGGWAVGANGYWSPLYPWLLAGGLRLFDPSPAGELMVVQAINGLVYLTALAAFIVFWRELDEQRSLVSGSALADAKVGLASWAWWLLGYLLFMWCALRLIRVWILSPDMAVFTLTLLAAALLLRLRRAHPGWGVYAAFGAVLGAAYLAKAVMFPLAWVFLGCALFQGGAVRRNLPRVALALVVFALVAAPFLATLSAQKGRLTFGDAGRLNYARYVNGVPDIHWQGEIVGSGTPVHPTRQLATSPAIYEFREPIGGTYPVWYDPTYWYEGVRTPIAWWNQVGASIRTAVVYADFLLLQQGAALAVLLILLSAAGTRQGTRALARQWPLLVPALAAFGLYALVYVEIRYLAPFLPLLWGAGLAAVRLPTGDASSRLLRVGAAMLAAVLALNLLAPNAKVLSRFLHRPLPEPFGYDTGLRGAASQLPAAEAIRAAGIPSGSEIAFIGYSYNAYWARLAGLRIVAEIPAQEAPLFWRANPEQRADILRTLFSTGVHAVVTEVDSRYPPPQAWSRLGETAYYFTLGTSP